MSPDPEVYVSSKKLQNMALYVAALALAVSVTGTLLGFQFPEPQAGASPAERPAGTLGIGAESVPPIEEVSADEKIELTAERPASLVTPVAKAKAPVPVAKPKPRPASARTAAAPRNRTAAAAPASASGWKSARASWYGPGFYGNRTASGAILTEGMMNVAHKTLPFGTRIEFKFGGRTAIAVVNDRGPFTPGRVFDLGPGTATALGFSGVHTVQYRILGR